MKKIAHLSLALVLVANLACSKQKLNKDDYLVFGHFYGECAGEECVELFKLERDKLFEDTKDIYPNAQSIYKGNFSKELPQSDFEQVEMLFEAFPDQLWDENTIIGQPDAGDWGGFYVEYKKGDETAYWLIDQMQSNIPDYLHTFNTKIRTAIEVIND